MVGLPALENEEGDGLHNHRPRVLLKQAPGEQSPGCPEKIGPALAGRKPVNRDTEKGNPMPIIVDRKTRDATADSRKRLLRMARQGRIAVKHMALSDSFIHA